MTLDRWLSTLSANPDDPASPLLYVAKGHLSDDEERFITSDYGPYPYAYLLGIGEVPIVRYDGGGARWLSSVDLVLEAKSDTDLRPAMSALVELISGRINFEVDELSPGVKRQGEFVCTRYLPPESRRKGFYEATLALETT